MPTPIPAPRYFHSPSPGSRPVNPEPADSTVAGDQKNTSIPAGAASRSEETPDPVSFRILTWNIWFENLLRRQRTSALIATIKSLDPLPDVCCFQECTSPFERQLRGDDWWRKTWAMTRCADQFAVTGFNYGTMMFVRRELVEKMEFKARAWFEPFETSKTGRGLLVMELTPPKSKHPLLIATSHLDYTPKIRATQFAAAISSLSATPASIFCGDTNIGTYTELKSLLSAGYVDSWLDLHPEFADFPDLKVGVTFGTAGLRGPDAPSNSGGPSRRLDYVMARGVKVKGCRLLGDEPIPKENWAENPEEQELELDPYVSDHLGVLVDVEPV